jgi:hypothetical protein
VEWNFPVPTPKFQPEVPKRSQKSQIFQSSNSEFQPNPKFQPNPTHSSNPTHPRWCFPYLG